VIHVVTPYGRAGASSRVRVYEWLDRVSAPRAVSGYVGHRNARPSYLARHPRSVLDAERRLRRIAAERPSRLLLHREASPLSRGSVERRLLLSADFTVYDFDDALQWDRGEGGIARRLAPKAPKARLAVATAARVIAGNPVLADWASSLNDDVIVIPSCVSPESYRQKDDYRVHDPPRLGWIGSADNEPYLQLIAPALTEVHRRTGARLTMIATTRRRLGDLEDIIDRIPWSERTQHETLATFDVGLFPVPDDVYSRGKCGYKLLQYAAAGLPAVATPVGVNQQLLAQLEMPAAIEQDEWFDGIFDLLTRSTESRASLGRRAREVARMHYSFDAWLPTWLSAVGIDDPRSSTHRVLP
jgi:glycosyltransferase involved in cell wall biosynthesis